MDEHTIKKKKYLSKVFGISNKVPELLVPLIEIVKAYPICELDVFFSKISITESELYAIYSEKCGCNVAEFVRYITQ
jgi:hypothetical protein